jgi:hypothetical protein
VIADLFDPYLRQSIQTATKEQGQTFCDCVALASTGVPVNDQKSSFN